MTESNQKGVQVDTEARSDNETGLELLLSSMTLPEKVGQMTQLTLAAVSCELNRRDVDLALLREALVDYHVGSIFNVCERALSPDDWHRTISVIQDIATRETRHGIPVLYGIDSVHGANYTVGATVFPHNLGLAASWNPDLVKSVAAITALETRSSGIPWTFAPVLDLGRQPLWSRFCETFGEDTHLATVMGQAVVEGLEIRGADPRRRFAACAKHFVGYGAPYSGKDRTPAYIPDNVLRDWFLPPFQAAVAAGVSSVMVNSGDVNGCPVHASRALLTDVLRGQLGFDGVIVSDWEDVEKLHTVHGVAASEKDAVRMAIDAGIDINMTPRTLCFHGHLLELVREGAISEERINDSVRRILKLKSDLGLFEDGYPEPGADSRVGSRRAGSINLQVARESITLLKNDAGTLPLDPSSRILVTGPTADSLPALHGPWSYTWQGTDVTAYPSGTRSLLAELRERCPDVSHCLGATWDAAADVEEAMAAAREADYALVCLGEAASIEKPGDIDDLNLEQAQLDLAKRIAATGTPTILILLTGRPRVIRGIVDDMSAIVMAYQPGGAGAAAIADVLFGSVNPSGKLPYSYPRYANDLVAYDHRKSEGLGRSYGLAPGITMDAYRPQFDFGFGLSYSSFQYHDLRVDHRQVGPGDSMRISVCVENVSRRDGTEVVQVYVGDDYASVSPPVRRLKAFRRVALASGEKRVIHFKVSADEFGFTNANGESCLEDGDFTIRVADLETKISLTTQSS